MGEGPADASIMGSSLLAVVNNISPHVTQLGRATSMKLVHVFAWMSAPAFLLASGSNVVLLGSVLRSINSLVESHETGHGRSRDTNSSRSSEAMLSLTLPQKTRTCYMLYGVPRIASRHSMNSVQPMRKNWRSNNDACENSAVTR